MTQYFPAILICFTLLVCAQGKSFEYPYLKKASSYSAEQRGYDYIIVGGGTAGCPLAATLSQNYSVLLLERGGSPYGNVNVSHLENFHISLADVSPQSASQAFISTDGVINSRARVLGGGSCINAGFYTRASPRYVRSVGWDGELVNESYPWVEKQIVHWPELAPWQQAFKDGLLEAGVSPFNGYTFDHIYGTKVGGTIFDKNGFRSTAADLLASGNPSNLNVLTHASVLKILFSLKGGNPRTRGVRFKDENGKLHHAWLKRSNSCEVILSSGAIGTPQLMMLSGIGPLSELKKVNIPVVLRNEFVGKGMSDNPMNTIFIPTKKEVKQSLIQIVGITKFGSYIEASSGFGQSADSIECNHGILSAEIGQMATVPPSQRTLSHMKEYAKVKKDLPRELFRGGFVLSKIVGPRSAGFISLNNTNIDETPPVTFNYFQHPEDLQRCVNGVKTMLKVVKTTHMEKLTEDDKYTMEMVLNMSVKANVNLIPKHENDTQSLEQYCKDTVITIWHYHGGCHVGKVVDKDYRVLGVNRLRVVDGSTFANSPGTNPQATVMMMGRYMGVKILRERLGRSGARV